MNAQLRTTAPHIFAAGDVTGHVMVVHEAAREAYLAATNAVLGTTTALPAEVSPLGSFTDPEYASVGLTETAARKTREVIVATQQFDSLPRPIIDGRPTGFCKLIADRQLHTILGCHIVGERAVELAQLAAIAMAANMTVEQLALVPFSFPTYANALGRAAIKAARELDTQHRPRRGPPLQRRRSHHTRRLSSTRMSLASTRRSGQDEQQNREDAEHHRRRHLGGGITDADVGRDRTDHREDDDDGADDG